MLQRRARLNLAASFLIAFSLVLFALPRLASAAGTTGLTPLSAVTNLLSLAQGPIAQAGDDTLDQYANSAFMPDWNGDGVYGDEGDILSEQEGAVPATGTFLYPCIDQDGAVTYKTTTGSCAAIGTAGVTFEQGIADRFKVTDARGVQLTATLWYPAAALQPGAQRFPGLVFANGALVPQRSYYMYDMEAAEAGFIVLSYDPVGQGSSAGNEELDAVSAAPNGSCLTTTTCRELQEMVRWFAGDAIHPEQPALGSGNPSANPTDPAAALLNPSEIAIAGQSNGSLAVSDYLQELPNDTQADGNPLVPVAAAVGMSGFAPASTVVPFQMQTGDNDIPGVTSTNGINMTDGPIGTSAYYDSLMQSGTGDSMLQMIIIKGASHGDTSDIPDVPHTVWGWAVSTSYFTNFLTCNVLHSAAGCAATETAIPDLSAAFASEYAPQGPSGSNACMTVPSEAALEQVLDVSDPLDLVLGTLGTPSDNCYTP